jgi:hypothetical protein
MIVCHTIEELLMKEFDISVAINGKRYEGKALYDEVTDKVDLSNITAEGIDVQSHLTDNAYSCGYNVGKVVDILANEVRGEIIPDDYGRCDASGYQYPIDDLTYCSDGEVVCSALAVYSNIMDEYLNLAHAYCVQIRCSDGSVYSDYVTDEWKNTHYYCAHCDSYLEDNDDYFGGDVCRWCNEENDDGDIIEGYCDSHRHNDHPVFFGGDSGDRTLDSFSGMGFELEVDSKDNDFGTRYNDETARNICDEAGLEYNEMRYAHDGSLNYGFECISQPHTVEDFWSKTKKWEKMLAYLLSRGYRSHDPGTCGLHVHVSRNMFGKSETTQDTAIAKVYTFYDENWDDLVKISRRKEFSYCDKNSLSITQKCDAERTGKFKQWKERSKASASKNHYVALNNSGRYTFEYRLARGTLNAWSFFSWIDLTLTITRNARRITIKQVETNDKVSWLSGITESTARYIYQRGAFRDTVLALYPSIAWSQDTRDTNDSDDDDD